MSALTLFQEGVTPALLLLEAEGYMNYCLQDKPNMSEDKLNGHKRMIEFQNNLKSQYPHILVHKDQQILYFQSMETVKEYLPLVQIDPEYPLHLLAELDDKTIGLAQGFPPEAVDFIINIKQDRLVEKAKINYYGLIFVCKVEDLQHSLDWLQENRPVSSSLKERLFKSKVSATVVTDSQDQFTITFQGESKRARKLSLKVLKQEREKWHQRHQ